MPHLRCGGGRLRAGRGLRDGGHEAAERRGGGRRPHLGPGAGIGCQPERRERRADGAERHGAGAGARRCARPVRDSTLGGGLPGSTCDGVATGRPDRSARVGGGPLLLGTAKTNIGHLEAAAGIAGLIKVLLAMKHGVIPKHLHFDDPNPHMEWDKLPVRVTSEATDWPLAPDHPPRAGVSAFAVSGTNAHVLVEGYGAPEGASIKDTGHGSPAGSAQPLAVTLPDSVPESPAAEEMRPRRTRMLPLSGKSDDALRESAGRYLSWLDERGEELSAEDAMQSVLPDMAWTAAVGRSHFAHRAGVAFEDVASLREGLRALAESDEFPKPRAAARVAFAYAGEEGIQVGMGEELHESEPVARAVLDHCDEALRVERGASLLDVMFGRTGELDDPAWSQPAAFALECALTALWASVGIRPSVVFGAGAGEIAAAHAAGVFTLEEGLRFAARRGALMEAIPGGEGEEAALDDLETALEGVVTALPSLTLVNQVTGRALGPGETLDGAYWRRQACEPAALGECVKTLAESGVEAIVEVGADSILTQKLASAWPESGGDEGASGNGAAPLLVLSSMRQSSASERRFVEAVAGAYESGLGIDFSGLFAGEERRRISLPGYPFQRRRFWFDEY
ncbi:MAG: type I polyketide synthase [Nitrospinae bacterium]|nr:type I polyketide synthase [Nitrospinota bacterium]